ncbi:MAG TPA: SDR family oxidoreductase [Thermoanaerobaculia bacterium]|nr:SDR family oxidoreductase [Thermoanaerobaculia bacterium]
MSFPISGSIALVTGANRGIGRALVDALLSRGAAKVYAAARNPETLEGLVASSGDRVVALRLDVRSLDEVRAAAEAAPDATLVINNAGVVGYMGQELTDPAWIDAARHEFEVNVVGTLAVTQAFAPVLARNGGGAVVNLASVASFAAFPALASYSASKAAVHSLTQATRQSLKAQGTEVFGVYPGPIDTDMARELPFEKTSPAEAAEAILDGVEAGAEEIFPDPAGRQMGEAFLASPKALERSVAAGEAV